MFDYIIRFLNETVYFFNEMAIYLIFGFFIAGILHIFFPESFILRHLGKNSIGSVIKASLTGIPLPICSCGVIPLAASIRQKGASKGATLSFLISTPQIGTDSFMITYSLIGWIFAVFRIIASFITALISGILANIFSADKEKQVEIKPNGNDKTTAKQRMHEIFSYMQYELFGSIANYLVVGIVLAGLIAAFVPDLFFETYLNNQFLSMILMLIVGIPMYICATASTPIAASLILKGISPGAALVFLLAGPATNTVTISMVLKSLGKKSLVIYLGSISIVSIALGYLLNYLNFNAGISIIHDHQHELLPPWLELPGSILLMAMLIFHYGKKLYDTYNKPTGTIEMSDIKTIKVSGMTCNHCKESVRKAVDEVAGTGEVMVDLSSGDVQFSYSTQNLDKIKTAIIEKGYEVVEDKS